MQDATHSKITDGTPLETDYLVIGTGATAMAFVDSLLDQQPDATVLMVDRMHRPGGHWNHAYPWVRVHQPSAWYGVASRELASGDKDQVGLNTGFYSMASGAEVLAHFDQVMQQRFLPSGRVRWLPMTDYQAGPDGTHRLTPLVGGEVQTVQVRRKVVDGTHARTEVPATHAPHYTVAPGVDCIPINELATLGRPYAHCTVVGSGKTGIDACLWLLAHGVAPSCIRWIMPRDAWYMDRANFQPGLENFEHNMGYSLGQFGAIAEAASPADLFARLEAMGALLRLDPTVEPTTYRCCTVSRDELALLRGIADVVRLGRLQAIEPARIQLDHGDLPADADTLYIDCSASAIQPLPGLPVFDGERINLLMVRWCQPLFSAALIAFVESHVGNDAERNALCAVVPSPETPADWVRMWAVSLANGGRWRAHPALHAWSMQCRLNSQAVMAKGISPDDGARMALIVETGKKAGEAAARLPALMAML
jgi:hypothetical protein